jgi:hypothetical protein
MHSNFGMTPNQNPWSTKRFSGHRLHWFKKIKSDLLFSNVEWNYNREWEKSKYLDNISVLPTSIFIFDKFVDSTQPEVAGEIAGRRHILRTLHKVQQNGGKQQIWIYSASEWVRNDCCFTPIQQFFSYIKLIFNDMMIDEDPLCTRPTC